MKSQNSLEHAAETTRTLDRQAMLGRRRFLKGLGVTLALPAFESLPGAIVSASAGAIPSARALGTTATGAPLRMAFVYVPNGVNLAHWWPNGSGKDFELNQTMRPLESLKNQVQVISGLDQTNANGGKDGPGDHARACTTFLTGVRAKKTSGADIYAGVSVDQVAARQMGHLTRFPSLELTCDATRKSGNCDSGYSCAYQYNLSWRTPTVPLTPEHNPRLVFERLFGAGPIGDRAKNLQLRLEQQKSVLDFVLDDAVDLQRQLGGRDRQKLDEYLDSVRELERQIEQAERVDRPAETSAEAPLGVPPTFSEHIDLMYDLMALAFQTDSTRVASFLLAFESSNRTFPEIGVNEGHHNLSHHQSKKETLEKIAKIDGFYVEHLARFLKKLAATKDVDGNSILHNSMIVYGSGNGDGNRHNHNNLPILVAGRGGTRLDSSRYLKLKPQPMSNLYLSMLDRMGVAGVARHGDSTGRLEGI
jgi:Protein of unknown function (DUF1552)